MNFADSKGGGLLCSFGGGEGNVCLVHLPNSSLPSSVKFKNKIDRKEFNKFSIEEILTLCCAKLFIDFKITFLAVLLLSSPAVDRKFTPFPSDISRSQNVMEMMGSTKYSQRVVIEKFSSLRTPTLFHYSKQDEHLAARMKEKNRLLCHCESELLCSANAVNEVIQYVFSEIKRICETSVIILLLIFCLTIICYRNKDKDFDSFLKKKLVQFN